MLSRTRVAIPLSVLSLEQEEDSSRPVTQPGTQNGTQSGDPPPLHVHPSEYVTPEHVALKVAPVYSFYRPLQARVTLDDGIASLEPMIDADTVSTLCSERQREKENS